MALRTGHRAPGTGFYMERFDLIPLLKRRRLTRAIIAQAAGCSGPNVTQFITGQHGSLRVARTIMRLAELSPQAMARLSGISEQQLKGAA
jgi:hypothetical protein